MDIFGFSADMLPKLSLLFSGYYVSSFSEKEGSTVVDGSTIVEKMVS